MSGEAIATAFVAVRPEPESARTFGQETTKVIGPQAEKAGADAGHKMGTGLKGGWMQSAKGLMAGAAGVMGITALAAGFGEVVAKAREARAAERITEQVITTTGGKAHVTAKAVEEIATALSLKTGIEDDAIRSGENLLLTFTGVRNEVGKGNDIFTQATGIIADMGVALGQDTKSSAIQLGKALNDPIKGVTALQRVGVSFTASQKEQIKTMVKSGDTLGAQKLILKELGTEFGGAAAAAADPMKKLGAVADEFEKNLGTALLPVIDTVANVVINNVIPALQTGWAWFQKIAKVVIAAVLPVVRDLWGWLKDLAGAVIRDLVPVIQNLWDVFTNLAGAVIRDLVPVIQNLWDVFTKVFTFLANNKDIFIAVGAVIITALVPALIGWLSATWGQIAANIVLAATFIAVNWPIMLIAAAIGALVFIIVRLWQNNETFRNVVTAVWNAVKTAITVVVQWFINTAWPIIQKVIGFIIAYYTVLWNVVSAVFGWILGKIGGFVSWFLTTFGPTIATVASKVGGFITGIWTVVQNVVGWITTAFGKVSGVISSAFSGIGGIIQTAFQGVKGFINEWIIDKLNGLIDAANHIPFTNIPHIPQLAKGGTMLADGLALVGEKGPEVVGLSKGSHVFPTGTGPVVKGGRGATVVTVNVDARGADAESAARFEQAARRIAEDVLLGVVREAAAS